jgi:putative hydrolase of the HAD superfamily
MSMRTRPLVVVDGDDTLWLTEHLYDEARSDCGELVARAGYDRAVWEATQRALDLHRSEVLGFSTLRFPGSCALAAHAVAKHAPRATRMELIRGVRARARTVFTEVATPREGAAALLAHISMSGARVILCTQGDDPTQRRRIADSGLAGLCDDIKVVPIKTPAVFARIADEHGAGDRLSIGNSPRSDIAPAALVGYDGVLVTTHAWEREREPTRLSSVPMVVRDLVQARHAYDVWAAGCGIVAGCA